MSISWGMSGAAENQRASIIREGKYDDERLERRVDELAEHVESLLLANRAMWTLLSQRLGTTDSDLTAVIDQLAAERDAARQEVRRCPECDAALQHDSVACQWCGHQIQPDRTFPF